MKNPKIEIKLKNNHIIMYIGIDASLKNTAISAFSIDNDNIIFNYVQSNQLQIQKEKEMYTKIINIKNMITNFIDSINKKYPIQNICYEDYSFHSVTNSITKLAELNGAIKIALIEKSLNIFLVPPTLVKKFATGKGTATKEEIISQFLKELDLHKIKTPEKPKNITSDLADSFFIAKFSWYLTDTKAYEKDIDMHRHRLEVVKKYIDNNNFKIKNK